MKVFISYRRADTAVVARLLQDQLRASLDDDSVFRDNHSIRASEDWQDLIEQALQSADTIVVLIGPSWLTVQNEETGRRRIDLDDDWVHQEVRHGLEQGKRLFPVLINGTPMPRRDILPEALALLPRRQALSIHWERIDRDLAYCVSEITSESPTMRSDGSESAVVGLTEEELTRALSELGDEWELCSTQEPRGVNGKRVELVREYEFERFSDVIAFMSACVEHIDEVDHHPRWENTYRSLKVWLSTWDVGYRPTRLDIDIARHLDTRFAAEGTPPRRQSPFVGGPFRIGLDQVESVAWSPDGSKLAACSSDGVFIVLDVVSGNEVIREELGENIGFQSVAWNGSLNVLAACRQGVLAWQVENQRRITMNGPDSYRDAAWSPGGGHVAAVSTRELRIWPLPGRAEFRRFKLTQDASIVRWLAADQILLGGEFGLATVQLDPANLEPSALTPLTSECGGVVALCTQGNTVYTGDNNGQVGQLIHRAWRLLGAHEHPIIGVDSLADGRIATSDRRGGLRVWEPGTANPSWTCPADPQTRSTRCGVSCHPSEPTLAVPGEDTRTIMLVNVPA